MVKESDFSPPYYRIIFDVFINRFVIQERKTVFEKNQEKLSGNKHTNQTYKKQS